MSRRVRAASVEEAGIVARERGERVRALRIRSRRVEAVRIGGALGRRVHRASAVLKGLDEARRSALASSVALHDVDARRRAEAGAFRDIEAPFEHVGRIPARRDPPEQRGRDDESEFDPAPSPALSASFVSSTARACSCPVTPLVGVVFSRTDDESGARDYRMCTRSHRAVRGACARRRQGVWTAPYLLVGRSCAPKGRSYFTRNRDTESMRRSTSARGARNEHVICIDWYNGPRAREADAWNDDEASLLVAAVARAVRA